MRSCSASSGADAALLLTGSDPLEGWSRVRAVSQPSTGSDPVGGRRGGGAAGAGGRRRGKPGSALGRDPKVEVRRREVAQLALENYRSHLFRLYYRRDTPNGSLVRN